MALFLRALLRRVVRNWHPMTRFCEHLVYRSIVLSLPFALAFAPALLMRRGLGVLIPASVYLFPELAGLPFQARPLNADDVSNLWVASSSFTITWGLGALVLFLRRSHVDGRNTLSDEHKV